MVPLSIPIYPNITLMLSIDALWHMLLTYPFGFMLLDILNFWRAVNLPGLGDLEGFATPQQKNVK
jgi:hypothetical protein